MWKLQTFCGWQYKQIIAWFVCDIWHKYHSSYFKIVSNFTRLSPRETTYNNFEISLVVFMANITTNHAIMYTNSVKITLNSKNASLCNILLLAGTWRVKQVLSIMMDGQICWRNAWRTKFRLWVGGMTEALFVPSLLGPFLSEKYEIHGNRSVILGNFYPRKE